MKMVVLRLEHKGWPVLLRVEHAALLADERLEVTGRQLARDGTPLGQLRLTVDVQMLPKAVVGAVARRWPRNVRWPP